MNSLTNQAPQSQSDPEVPPRRRWRSTLNHTLLGLARLGTPCNFVDPDANRASSRGSNAEVNPGLTEPSFFLEP